MMSDSDLDDLHQSILTLCGKDAMILKEKDEINKTDNDVEKDKEKLKIHKEFDKTEKVNSKVTDSTNCIHKTDEIEKENKIRISYDGHHTSFQKSLSSPSNSSMSCSVTSVHCSDYDTVDEASCSDNEDDFYTTTVDRISTFNSTTLDESSQLYHTVDETISGSAQKHLEPTGNDVELKENKSSKMDSSFHLSPIKDVGNESRLFLATPATPSFMASNKCQQFAQSTPLNKLAVTGKAVRQVENESGKNGNEITDHGRKKKENKNKSMFEFDESDFSDMSFDDLLIDTFTMCKGTDIDWKLLFTDVNVKVLHPKLEPPYPYLPETENIDTKEKRTVECLGEWKMLYGDPNTLQSGESDSRLTRDASEIHNKTVTNETIFNKTLTEENATGDKSDSKSVVNCTDKMKTTGSVKVIETASNPDSPDISKNLPSTSKVQDQNISKIKIDSIFADKQPQEKDKKQNVTGRFSNFTSSFLSDIEVTEDESEQEESEDILGLNNYTYSETDDIDLDEEDEATLLDETITDLPESIKNKYKVHEQVSILNKSQGTDGNKTVIENKDAVTDVNKNFMKQVSKATSEEVKQEDKEKENLVKTEVKEGEVAEDKENSDLQKITGKIDYEAERKYFDIETPEVREIIDMWGSKGIQDPDTNLSFAKKLRAGDPQQKGMLEGNHISCIWLQESAAADKECSSPMKKRQKLDSQAHTRRDIEKLQHELGDINFRHEAHLRGLFQEWKYEKVCLEDRHRPVFHQLKYRQVMEMKENYERFRHTNIPLFQMNVIRLHAEHAAQQEECRARFNADIVKLEHLFQRREVEIERNFNHRKAQLVSLIEQIRQVKTDGKYGHHVTAQFVKGPCRSNNQTRSLVEVYVPAEVASCILKEDEIIDSFYKYA